MTIGEVPRRLVQQLASLQTLADFYFSEAYTPQEKPFPVRRTVVSVENDKITVRQAEIGTDAFEAELRLVCTVHVPLSAGGKACHEAAGRLLHSLLFEAGLAVSGAGCEPVSAYRSTDSLCMAVWVLANIVMTKEEIG